MKKTLSLLAVLFLVASSILGIITYREGENEGELLKAIRDPDRVDKRWVYVTGLGTAAFCFALWSANSKSK
jgi:hypothetical protein